MDIHGYFNTFYQKKRNRTVLNKNAFDKKSLLEYFDIIYQEKYNAHHDALGRFSHAAGAHLVVHSDGTRELGLAHPDHPNNKAPNFDSEEYNSSHYDGLSFDKQQKLLEKQEKSWTKQCSKQEIKAVKDYSAMDYHSINDTLRGNINKSNKPTSEKQHEISEKINSLTDALNHASLPEPITTYRKLAAKKYNFKYFKEHVGSVYEDHGFSSTTADNSFAQHFRADEGNNVIMKVHVPKGYPATSVRNLSYVKHEHEVLLQRGAQFHIAKAYKEGKNNVVEVYVLPPKKAGGKFMSYMYNYKLKENEDTEEVQQQQDRDVRPERFTSDDTCINMIHEVNTEDSEEDSAS